VPVTSKEELEERLAFLSITEADLRALQSLRPLFERRGDSFVTAFYRHLLSFETTRALLRDPGVKRRVFIEQKRYLLSLTDPVIDEAYVADRRQIGETHEQIGLEPRWFLGAYATYFYLLSPLVGDHLREDPVRGDRTLASLMKRLVFDAQIVMDGYMERRERELEYLNQELAAAGRSLAREVEVQQAELRITTERARAAEELAGVATVVAGLAHEIGTPMSVIRGHAELLESSVTNDRARWRLRTIRDQIDRISNLIRTLLNIARPKEPARVPVELAEIIDSTLTFLTDKFSKRNVTVALEVEEVPPVRGDAERLQQLFLNLFLNSVDAMEEGGTLRVNVEEAGQDRVEILVSDTGKGIPPEDLRRIFDTFYTTKPAGEGSGLGLVVARTIVLDHDGTIDVTSEVGKGTEFRITFPRADLSLS
jgi:signal transduction histidine kinase